MITKNDKHFNNFVPICCHLRNLHGCLEFAYTQYPIIRNGLKRNSAEFLEKFKKRALGRSNLRNASNNL